MQWKPDRPIGVAWKHGEPTLSVWGQTKNGKIRNCSPVGRHLDTLQVYGNGWAVRTSVFFRHVEEADLDDKILHNPKLHRVFQRHIWTPYRLLAIFQEVLCNPTLIILTIQFLWYWPWCQLLPQVAYYFASTWEKWPQTNVRAKGHQ